MSKEVFVSETASERRMSYSLGITTLVPYKGTIHYVYKKHVI